MVDKVGVATIMRLTTPMVGCIALPAAMGMAHKVDEVVATIIIQAR